MIYNLKIEVLELKTKKRKWRFCTHVHLRRVLQRIITNMQAWSNILFGGKIVITKMHAQKHICKLNKPSICSNLE